MGDELLPCPFCGAGTSEIRENGRTWQGMKYGEPASVSVRHWCAESPGQPSRMIERVGRDRASAIAAWNTRAAQSPLQTEVEKLAALSRRLDDIRREYGLDVPDGWKLVPVEPTPEMIQRGNAIDYAASTHRPARLIYAGMLAAAPKPPSIGQVLDSGTENTQISGEN